MVDIPEDYRWNSLGYHIQTENKGDFLSLDFGLKEFGPRGIRSAVNNEFHGAGNMPDDERLRLYRRYVYETGAVNHPEKGRAAVIDENILEKERANNFEVIRIKPGILPTPALSAAGNLCIRII